MTTIVIAALTLLLSTDHVTAKSPTAENVSSYAISGWWSDCDFYGDQFKECSGSYKQCDPTRLDPAGNTCYVNPHADPSSTTNGVVFWFGPSGSDLVDSINLTQDQTNIYYYMLLVSSEDAGLYMPTNCTDSGACSCESLEPLRGSWLTTGTCNVDCNSGIADILRGGDCAVFVKTSTINKFGNDTIVTCAIQGSLIDLSGNSTPTMPITSGQTKVVTMSRHYLLGILAMSAILELVLR